MNSKYVIIEVGGCEVPIVFAAEIEHRSMASLGRLISAGWCEPRANWLAFGLSESLGVSCRADRDSELLRIYFGRPVEEALSNRPDVDVPLRSPRQSSHPRGAD